VAEAPEDIPALAVGAVDSVVAADARQRAELWRYREGHTQAVNTRGPPHKFDVTLPARELAEFVVAVPLVVTGAAPVPVETWMWGHAGDGNVHVNVTGLAPDDGRVDDAVLRFVADLGGSISAEHGIGRAKRAWLGLNRSPSEIAAFRAIKGALDPDGILNPSVLLP
jgi:FAD/FMN-containing dehydrogenase